MSRDIYVYADWVDEEPTLVGTLTAEQVRGKEHFSFAYALDWLQRGDAPYLQVDPELHLFEGIQHKGDDYNFRVFLDSCPDRWGRVLMQRREAVLARQDGRRPKTLYESDYLLGVFDQYRMGALRFKTDRHGAFLDDDERLSAPPITSLRELEHAVCQIEQNVDLDDPEYMKWLFMLISPGSSLGGARPKASVIDEEGNLWIAKFPSQQDDHDIGAWEFLAYRLAVEAGIVMADSRIERFNSPHHTFLTKRFDRERERRMHFSSAMTQLGYYDGEDGASYLELAEFLTNHGSNTQHDLAELWRRIVFNIAVSNVDDHLRNHGFLFEGKGWKLSPAYDINPTAIANGLHLNIDDKDNSLSYELAFEVIEFFQLSQQQAEEIFVKVLASVGQWREIANQIGISRAEQDVMKFAFNIE
ncbi:type II toxin-antitoxin system HipA family toxin [Nitrincola iocasae]|uniref:Type II toxin-antitoxin system HipA family toxin n=1 Tax=Nitrincola iocasae TaxID=2614693 RepID=A0A5J6LCI3_9GAMM|nr:HipA domain-containing protein [Nitrincola iocasae]QEW06309.1 type II toxin-antitoxin system HipA family toxin [Nitrincola iocasae]